MRHLTIMLAAALFGCSDDFNFAPAAGGAGGTGGALAEGGSASAGGPDVGGAGGQGGGEEGGGGGQGGGCTDGHSVCEGDVRLLCQDDEYQYAEDCSAGGGICLAGSCETELALRLAFDEGVGGVTFDDVTGAMGQLAGATWAAGQAGASVALSGAGEVTFGAILDDIALPFSITAWVHVPAAVDSTMTVIATDGSMPYQGAWLLVDAAEGNTLVVGFGDTGGQGPNDRHGKRSSLPVPTGRWAHVAGVYRLPNDADLYVDGVAAGGAYTGGATFVAAAGEPLRVGNSPLQGAALTGSVDEVRVYRRALEAPEVAELAGVQR